MGEDKETRQRLLDSAKQEFLEKGYMKASLRGICKNAGVTTGALYFFFQDKEDLLKNLIEEPLQGLIAIMESHFSEEVSRGSTPAPENDWQDDVAVAKEIVRFMFQHYDIFQILLTKSQGSAYEDITSRFADRIEEHYRLLAEQMADQVVVPMPDHYMIHWLSHVLIDLRTHVGSHWRRKTSRSILFGFQRA